MDEKFHAGELAQIKSTGEVVTINALSVGIKQNFYLVFQNGKKNRYREDELIPYIDSEELIIDKIQNNEFANADSFQKYVYYRLFSESQESNLFSYQGNKLIFNPFQYKPLMKFLSLNSDERLLIADEVGVGKTIESGIIIDELISRGELSNNDAIMIVCPSILSSKWRSELRNKFLIDDFYIHNGKSLEYMLNNIKESGKVQYSHSIVSEQLFRAEKYQKLLKECLEELGEPFFKLLIVDECHHYRNPGTNTHKFGSILSLCSERVIMLSATPFNLRSEDLYNQLHMLNPTLFSEEKIFNELLNQIRIVNKSIALIRKNDENSHNELLINIEKLKCIAQTNEVIKDDFNVIYDKITNGAILSVKDKVDFEKIAEKLNPISTSFTRTLKRDAIEHRVTRETITLEVNFTQQEADVYNSFLEINLQRYKLLGISERAFGLILNGLERIASSSIVSLTKNVKKYINMPIDNFIEMMSENGEVDIKTAQKIKQLLSDSYGELSNKIKLIGNNDSKYNTFKKLVQKVQQATGDNKRIIVFSFYTETLKYLRKKLTSDGYSVALMYGKTPEVTSEKQVDEDGFKLYGRSDIMRDFEKGKYEILLVSEVGGEGLDFQFCSALINYDLPYNPMRIEQRIGRIDRMGQMSDKIIIGNLCITNTIDVSINRVLMSRIADASDLVGELEPIIAQELAQMNELIITNKFSDDELRKREKDIEQRIEKAKQTREEFDEVRYELVNDKGFKEEFEENIKKSRITPHESLLFTYSFLKKENGCSCKRLSQSAGMIHITKDMCDRVKSYYRKMNLGQAGLELKKLLDNNGDAEVDFDGNSAYINQERIFFKPAGAWIHFIIDYIKAFENDEPQKVFYATVKNNLLDKLDKGRYWIFCYEMEFKGFFETKSYEYIISSQDGNNIFHLTEEDEKILFQQITNGRLPNDLLLDNFDEIKINVEDIVENKKEEIMGNAISHNNIKIGSRIEAIKKLSNERVRQFENDLISSDEKAQKRIRRAILKEESKANDKIAILQEKLKCVGTYALDGICLIDVG